MKFTINWLKEHLDTKIDDQKIIEKLTSIGLEVESFESQPSELDKFIVPLNFPKPDLTIYLDLPVEEGLKRAKERDNLDRFEAEEINFFERIRNSYLKLAKEDSDRIFTIDSTNSEAVVFKLAKDRIKEKLNEN